MRFIQKQTKPMPEEVWAAYDRLGIAPVTAQLLYLRDILPEDAPAFLAPQLEGLHDPFLFRNMQAVCERLHRAMAAEEQIVIYGDYDCDGVCGSVILKRMLDALGLHGQIYLPDRATEGYGTNHAAFEKLMDAGAQLIITVDCGIRSNEDVAYAASRGVDVIILDHHECGELPETPYILNGKAPGETYPFGQLCGAGTAFKLAQAMLGQQANAFLEFAGVATIADMVPLLEENRILAYYGLQNLRNAPSMGMKSLMAAAGIRQAEADAGSVGFGIAPRINVAGRLAHGRLAVELLLSETPAEAMPLAEQLNSLNEKRQSLQKKMIAEAEEQVRTGKDLSTARVLMVASDQWDKGIVGLAASSLAATFGRPTVVLSLADGMLTGSARSLPGINLYGLLCTCEEKYSRFGGHEMAAGLTFPAELLPEIEAQINAAAREQYAEEAFLPTAYYDLPLQPAEATLGLAEQIQALSPFGQDHEEPVFLIGQYTPKEVKPLGDGSHLKLLGEGPEVLWFRATGEVLPGEAYTFCGTLGINAFRGRRTPQMIVRSLQPCAMQSKTLQTRAAQGYLRSLPGEILALCRAAQPEGDMQALFAQITQCVSQSTFGTAVFAASAAGAACVARLRELGLQLPERLSLQPDSAENCICYGLPPQEIRHYTHIFVLGSYAAAPADSRYVCYTDGETHRQMLEEIRQSFVPAEELMPYARALYEAGKDGFTTLSQLLKGAAVRLNTKNIKKIWFAWKVCTQQQLLQMRKNGKIYVTFNAMQPNWQENALFAAAETLL